MKTCIYYFTGTGNSLKIAKDLALKIGDADLISIPQVIDRDEIHCPEKKVGIIYPIYCFGIPPIVVDFIKKLKINEGSYTFMIANHGMTPGPGGTVLQARKLMASRGIDLSAIFIVRMVGNYTPLFGLPGEEKQKKIFDDAGKRIEKITEVIKNREEHKMSNFFLDIFRSMLTFLNKLIVPITPNEDKHFRVDEKCNSCGTCEKLCPVSNIKLSNGKPVWLHHCQQCMSCFSLCPAEAIQIGKKSEKSPRYKNPDILLKDIIDSNSRC